MGLLQDIVHTITGNHGAPQAAEPVRGMASQFTPIAQPMQFAQYMNKDGSGGGFGPHNPSAAPQAGMFTRPQAMTLGQSHQINTQQFPVINQGGVHNPGFVPLQNSNSNYYQSPQHPQLQPIQGNQSQLQGGIGLY